MDPIFQSTDLSTHVQNCSNDECILPTCVNWKLNIAEICHKQPQEHKKRERSTIASDGGNKKENLRHDKEVDEATALFFEDLEELMKGDLEKECLNCLATETGHDAKNSFQVSQSKPECNQLHIGVDNDVNLTLNSHQNESDEFAQFPLDKLAMILTGLSPDESTARSLETQSVPLEKFIPIDDFSINRRPSSGTTSTTATTEATEKSPFFCTLKDYKLAHEDESKLKNQGSVIQPTNAKRLWGILRQILQMIEKGSVSEDSEAFCVQVLQNALAELKVRFFPPK